MVGVLLASGSAQAADQPLAPDLRRALAELSADSLRRHVEVLGSDALAGRAPGTPGVEAAAEYLAGVLRQCGWLPAGADGSYFQTMPLHGSRPLPRCRREIGSRGGDHRLELGADYLLLDTGAKTFLSQPAPLVFVGYGIVAPEFDYNDYQGVGVDGAVVVFLAGEPPSADPGYFLGERPTLHALPEAKRRQAIARGAVGSILLPSPRHDGAKPWRDWVQEFAFEHVTSLVQVSGNLSVLLRPERAPLLFAGSPLTVDEVYRMDLGNDMRSVPLATTARFQGEFAEREFLGRNVAARRPGRQPQRRDEYVLVAAHYDHLGIGSPVHGDSIYNGVVDNAVGVAGVLEMARALARSDAALARSVVLLLTTGEESGLLGSRFYCTHPLVPLHQTIAAVNVDGLGVLDTFDDVVAVGAEFSDLDQHLRRAADQLGLSVSPVPSLFLAHDAFARSDQLAFAQAGVPSLLVMEGFRYRHLEPAAGLRLFLAWGERYHSPFDDLEQPLDYQAMAHHARVILALVGALANTSEPPRWESGTPYHNARLRSRAEAR